MMIYLVIQLFIITVICGFAEQAEILARYVKF